MIVVVALLVGFAAGGLVVLTVVRSRRSGFDLVERHSTAVGGPAFDARSGIDAGPGYGMGSGPAPGSTPDAGELQRQIEALLRRRKKIEAIKLLRSYQPMSLRDAKLAVERLEAGAALTPASAAGAVGFMPTVSAEAALAQQLTPAALGRVRDLCRQGRKIAAIKELREHTGMGLREAKETVERML